MTEYVLSEIVPRSRRWREIERGDYDTLLALAKSKFRLEPYTEPGRRVPVWFLSAPRARTWRFKIEEAE